MVKIHVLVAKAMLQNLTLLALNPEKLIQLVILNAVEVNFDGIRQRCFS